MNKRPDASPSQLASKQTQSDPSPFHTALGSDPSLYLLHSAYLALLANDGDTSSSAYPSSSSLPLTSARQANTFLAHLHRQAKVTTETSAKDDFEGRFRSSLWPIAASSSSSSTEQSDLNDAISLLPSHWTAHNAFCPHCGALSIPAITTTSLLPRVPSQRVGTSKKRKWGSAAKVDQATQRQAKEAAQGPLQCLICCSPHKGASSIRVLSREEKEVQQIAKARFPMTRSQRQRDGKGQTIESKQDLLRESAKERKRAMGQEQASSSSVDEKTPQKHRSVSTIDNAAGLSKSQTMPLASQSSESNAVAHSKKKEKQKVQKERPRTVLEEPSPPPKLPPPSKTAEPIVPPVPSKPSKPSHDDSTSKKMPSNSKTKRGEGASDHKSALKAMLMKDKKRKQQQEAAESTSKSGGGGLRDFLAGL